MHKLRRREFHDSIPRSLSNGYSFFDSIVDSLYRGREDDDEARFRKKVRRNRAESPQNGGPL